MGILRTLVRTVFIVLLLTVVGQIPTPEGNLETRYHRFVSTPAFQQVYWTAVRPATWTFEKLRFLVDNRERASAR